MIEWNMMAICWMYGLIFSGIYPMASPSSLGKSQEEDLSSFRIIGLSWFYNWVCIQYIYIYTHIIGIWLDDYWIYKIWIYNWIYIYIYIRTYVRPCMHACMHAYIHTYIHTVICEYMSDCATGVSDLLLTNQLLGMAPCCDNTCPRVIQRTEHANDWAIHKKLPRHWRNQIQKNDGKVGSWSRI